MSKKFDRKAVDEFVSGAIDMMVNDESWKWITAEEAEHEGGYTEIERLFGVAPEKQEGSFKCEQTPVGNVLIIAGRRFLLKAIELT